MFERWRPLLLLPATVAVLATAACGGGSGPAAATTPAATAPAASAVGSATRPASAQASPTVTVTATATPSAMPLPPVAEAKAAAIAAAVKALDARVVSPLNRDACLQDNPARKVCIALEGPDASVQRGLAEFGAGDPEGGGFRFLMGRSAAGEWGFWFGSQQQFYVQLVLPGTLLACGEGNGVAVRVQPSVSSAAVSTVKDLTQLRAQEFVLTTPGKYGAGGARGEGWYHVTTPVDGWVQAREATDAKLGNCRLRDSLEGSATHG
ncbi:MAG: hypothetical protein HYX53_13670 [Chloroflexi bacterium]|nr:hypothetical protein [Chloroflexota bacterium]